MARRRRSTKKGWSVDKSGRWRDERGRYLSRERLMDGLALGGTPAEVSALLKGAARNAGRSKKRFQVMANFDGVGWRTLANSEGGLKVALTQGSTWLVHGIGLRLDAEYRKLDKVNRRKLRRGENVEPQITDIRIVPLKDTKHERRGKRRKKGKKR